VVRSSAAAGRFAVETPDLKALASEADVDRVVMGTLLRIGDQVRAVAHLVEAPSGRLIASNTVQADLGDLFRLQDNIARRVAEALSLPLAGASSSSHDSPQNPAAYELYLRANELARSYDGLGQARQLYQESVEHDPGFAPAWARLGRCHRVIGKFVDGAPGSETRAQEAFDRALALSPALTIAHKFYANLEADIGLATRAMIRLLEQASRHGNDPELFAGLVHALRYCGLFDQSIVAHEEARRLDPHVPTSVEQTVMMTGDIERLLSMAPSSTVGSADHGIRVIGLGLAGRRDEAKQRLAEMSPASSLPALQTWKAYLAAWLDHRPEDMRAGHAALGSLKIMDDPEAIFQIGWMLCDAGDFGSGVEMLQRAVRRGYFVVPTLSQSPQFDWARDLPAFRALLAEAEAGRLHALEAFWQAGGEKLLGEAADPTQSGVG
jgi:tetratricopeptide (TPR) repeat protein